MKRIKLTHGTARVSDNITEETKQALNKLSELAYNHGTKPELYNVLPTVFIAKTRDEAHDKMNLGEYFEAPSQLSKYNKSMIDFWADKYNYIKEKSRHGYHIYKPA